MVDLGKGSSAWNATWELLMQVFSSWGHLCPMTQYEVCPVLHGEAAVPLGLCWSRKGIGPLRSWNPLTPLNWGCVAGVQIPGSRRRNGCDSPVTAAGPGFSLSPAAISGELAPQPRAAGPAGSRRLAATRPPPAQPLTCHRRWLAQHQPPILPLRRQDSVRGRPCAPAPRPRPHPRAPALRPRGAPTFLPSRSLTWPSTSAASVIFCHGSRRPPRPLHAPGRPSPGSLSK